MKKIIAFFVIGIVFSNCEPQTEKSNQSSSKSSTEIQNNEIIYEIDSSKWYVQNPKDLIEFMSSSGQEPRFKDSEIVGLFTQNRSPVLNYPSIMIMNTKTLVDPPSLSQLEKELGAMTLSLEDVERDNKMELNEVVKDFDFETPILIKEKRLILMETTAQIQENQTLKIRQSMYFRGRNIVAIQISYVEGRDDKYLEDFNKIVETIEF